MDSFNAYLLLRSIRTYDLRIENMVNNAEKVIDKLSKSEVVKEIYYPFKFNNADQKYFREKYNHYGSLITFLVDQDINLEQNISKLQSTKMAPSFGSVDTLIEIPKYMSKRQIEQKKEDADFFECRVIDPRLVRLSVGCEPIKYILDDIDILLSI